MEQLRLLLTFQFKFPEEIVFESNTVTRKFP